MRVGVRLYHLGPSVVPFYPFLGEGSPTEIDYRKQGTLILTSLLQDSHLGGIGHELFMSLFHDGFGHALSPHFYHLERSVLTPPKSTWPNLLVA